MTTRFVAARVLAKSLSCPAAAEWTKAQHASFIGSCIEGRQTTPGLSAKGRAACYFPTCAQQAVGQ